MPNLLPSTSEFSCQHGFVMVQQGNKYAANLEASAVLKTLAPSPKSCSGRLQTTGGDSPVSFKLGNDKLSNDSWTLDGMTTLMLRNIPCSFSSEKLALMIDDAGFAGLYDWLYVPSSKHKKSANANLGYAFINFIAPENANVFANQMDGAAFSSTRSSKTMTISPAATQFQKNQEN